MQISYIGIMNKRALFFTDELNLINVTIALTIYLSFSQDTLIIRFLDIYLP